MKIDNKTKRNLNCFPKEISSLSGLKFTVERREGTSLRSRKKEEGEQEEKMITENCFLPRLGNDLECRRVSYSSWTILLCCCLCLCFVPNQCFGKWGVQTKVNCFIKAHSNN